MDFLQGMVFVQGIRHINGTPGEGLDLSHSQMTVRRKKTETVCLRAKDEGLILIDQTTVHEEVKETVLVQ